MMSRLLFKYYKKEDYVFVFDKHQKDFYLSKGLMIVDSAINEDTKKMFWIFNIEETRPYYGEWLDSRRERHMAQ